MASTLRFDNWENSNGDVIGTAANGYLGVPGTVLQVVSTTKTDTFSTTSLSMTDITGLSATITPKSLNSKILVMSTVSAATGVATFGYVQISRNGSAIFIGDTATSRPSVSAMVYHETNHGMVNPLAISHLDSPETVSAVTYSIQGRAATSDTLYINRSQRDSASGGYDPRVASSITLIEIAG